MTFSNILSPALLPPHHPPVAGCQQHPGAEGREGHLLQPTVAAAVTVQLAQVAAQVAAELPAPGLGDADRPQRSAVLH